MSLAKLRVSMPRFMPEMPGAREALARQQAVEQRALRIREALPVSPETARRVALFSLGGWAQNTRDEPYDINESAAIYIAGWLIARNVDDTDTMHEALLAWHYREFVESTEAPIVLDVRALLDLASPTASTARFDVVEQQPNRLARRAAASRRRSK